MEWIMEGDHPWEKSQSNGMWTQQPLVMQMIRSKEEVSEHKSRPVDWPNVECVCG